MIAKACADEVIVNLGMLLMTRGAQLALDAESVRIALGRHMRGDWGELDGEDKRANDRALARGGRLLSAYRGESGAKFWIITEADRSSTTVLLPDEY